MTEAMFQSERMRTAGRWLLGVLLFVLFAPQVAASCLPHRSPRAHFAHAPMCQVPVLHKAPVDVNDLLRIAVIPELPALAALLIVAVVAVRLGLVRRLKRLPSRIVHWRRFFFWIRAGTRPFGGERQTFLPCFCPRSQPVAC